jgi:alpha-beta hydrolase superfamily lysophospholipase
MTASLAQIIALSFFADGLELHGNLHLPNVNNPPVVIGCHGLFSSQMSPKQIALAEACNHAGIAFFRFDHRGCGLSQGDFQQVTSLAARVRDLKAAIDLVRDRPDVGTRVGLFGSSMGGSVCLSLASDLKIDAAVTFAAPLRSNLMNRNDVQSANIPSKAIYLDARQTDFDISKKIPRITNLLIVHGKADKTVPVDHAYEIYRLAQEPKRLIIQSEGDHRMSKVEHQRQFTRDATKWLKSRLAGEHDAPFE